MRIETLTRYHEDLDKLFLSHQISLVEHQFDEAITRLERFTEALYRHVRDEDEYIFPAYRVAVGSQPGATVEMFEAEHRKIEALLARIGTETRALPLTPLPVKILALLERETQFKNLLEHHFLREQNLLFPALDRELPENEKDRLLAHCVLRAIADRLPAKRPTTSLTKWGPP